MTPEERANKLAALANGCCHRSDGYEESIAAAALAEIRAAVAEERRRINANAYDNPDLLLFRTIQI